MILTDSHHHHTDGRLGIYNTAIGEVYDSAFSCGFHPMQLSEEFPTEEDWGKLEHSLQHKNCLAVGECGLDARNPLKFKIQQKILLRQIHLAKEMNKPIILHCVRLFPQLMVILKEHRPKFALHDFNKKYDSGVELIQLGGMLSVGTDLLRYEHLQQGFQKLPIEHLLIETDEADIPLERLYEKAAALKNMETAAFAEQIHQNFLAFYHDTGVAGTH